MAGAAKVRWRELASAALAPRAALILLGVWLNAADTLITATIMPSVARELGGYAWFGWSVAGYLLGSILSGATAGRFSERLGLRTAVVLAAGVYAVGCALSAAAPSILLFQIGRLIQGIGAGWIVGLCYVAIGVMFPPRLWPRMFGATAGMWGAASLLGPLVGGLFAAAGFWRGAFWVFAVQGLAFAGAAAVLLAGKSAEDGEPPRPLAWRTLGLLAAAIGVIGAADVVGGRAGPAVLVGLGIGLLVLAARVNARSGEHLAPAQATSLASRAGAGFAMIAAMSAASSVFGVYGAAILQIEYRLSPLAAGYVMAVDAIAWTVAALVVSSQAPERHGRFILAGASVIAAAVALMAEAIGVGVGAVVAAAVLLGAGFGLSWSLATGRILAVLPDADRAIGAAAVPTTSLIGGAVGAAGAGAIANLLGLAHAFTPQNAHREGGWLFAAFIPLAVLGWLAAFRFTRPSRAA